MWVWFWDIKERTTGRVKCSAYRYKISRDLSGYCVFFSNRQLQVISYLATIKGEIQCNNEIKEALWIDRNYKELGIKVGSILGDYVILELVKRRLM